MAENEPSVQRTRADLRAEAVRQDPEDLCMTSGNEGSAIKITGIILSICIIFVSGCTGVEKGDLIPCSQVATIMEKWAEPGAFTVDGFSYYVNASTSPVPVKVKREVFAGIPMNQTIIYTTGWYTQGIMIDGYQKITVEPVKEPGYRNTCRVI